MVHFAKKLYNVIKRTFIEFLEKFYKTDIFIFKEFSANTLNNENAIINLNDEERSILYDSLDLIAIYNSDFKLLKCKYLYCRNIPNFNGFVIFIKSYDFGYYVYKSIISIIIRLFLLLAQLFINIFLFFANDNFLINISDDNDSVVKKKCLLFFKIFAFVLDGIIFLFEIKLLMTFKRIRIKKQYIIVYQIIRIILLILIIVFQLLEDDYFKKMDNNQNISYKNQFLKKICFIYDVIKIFIY